MDEKMRVYDECANVAEVIRNMEVGDVAVFPIARMTTARVSSCNLGLELDRKYSTKTDRETRTISVTREE